MNTRSPQGPTVEKKKDEQRFATKGSTEQPPANRPTLILFKALHSTV